MTDLLSLLEAAARESIPYGGRVARWVNQIDKHGRLVCRCEVKADERSVCSAEHRSLHVAVALCARAFVESRPDEHTPAVEALRQAVTR